jgi:hypothetical protein
VVVISGGPTAVHSPPADHCLENGGTLEHARQTYPPKAL